MPVDFKKVALEYLSENWLLSKITWTSTPLLNALTMASAIREFVKE